MSPKTTPSAASVSAAWEDLRERESCSTDDGVFFSEEAARYPRTAQIANAVGGWRSRLALSKVFQ
jgi:hypothetical protein